MNVFESFRFLSFLALTAWLAVGSFAPPSANGQDLDFAVKWKAAADAYQAKDYPKARQVYEALIENSETLGVRARPDLYFNLGNTFYQQGERGLAAWMYEKTLVAAPRHKDARDNLALVRSSAAIPKSEAFFLFRPVAWLYSRLTASEWAGLFTFFYVATSAFASLWILPRADSLTRRLGKVFCLAGLCCTAVTVAFLAPRYVETEKTHFAVVVQTGAVVRSAPGPEEEKYFEALQGERLEVTEAGLTGWLRVKRPADGRVGYLPEQVLRKI